MKALQTTTAIILAVAISGAAWAEAPTAAEKEASPLDGFSITIDAVSDYRDRGLSLSDDSPALQVSLDWEHEVTLVVKSSNPVKSAFCCGLVLFAKPVTANKSDA